MTSFAQKIIFFDIAADILILMPFSRLQSGSANWPGGWYRWNKFHLYFGRREPHGWSVCALSFKNGIATYTLPAISQNITIILNAYCKKRLLIIIKLQYNETCKQRNCFDAIRKQIKSIWWSSKIWIFEQSIETVCGLLEICSGFFLSFFKRYLSILK